MLDELIIFFYRLFKIMAFRYIHAVNTLLTLLVINL